MTEVKKYIFGEFPSLNLFPNFINFFLNKFPLQPFQHPLPGGFRLSHSIDFLLKLIIQKPLALDSILLPNIGKELHLDLVVILHAFIRHLVIDEVKFIHQPHFRRLF